MLRLSPVRFERSREARLPDVRQLVSATLDWVSRLRSTRTVWIGLALALLTSPSFAQQVTTSPAPETVAVTVEVVQSGLDSYWNDTRITSESLKSERRSSDEAVWRVPVPANGTATLTAVFDTRY